MPANPFDRDFFSVFSVLCRHKGELYFAELAPATKTLAAVVDDIATGQIEHVLMVFRWKPAEYTCEDISYEIARTIITKYIDDDGFATDHAATPFLEEHLGCATVTR